MSTPNTHGNCNRCGDRAPLTAIVCAGCGSRLPWAQTASKAKPAAAAPPPAPTTVLPPGGLPPSPGTVPLPASWEAPKRVSVLQSGLGASLWKVGVGLLLVALFMGVRYHRSPQYSLWQAQRAFAAHNLDVFENYVNIETVSEHAVDDMLEGVKPKKSATQPQDAATQWGEDLAESMVEGFKPLVYHAMKQAFRFAVENNAESRPGDTASMLQVESVEELELKAAAEQISYAGISYVQRDGESALVGLSFVNTKDAAKSFVIELKMRQRGSYWQVTRWNNLKDLMQKLDWVLPQPKDEEETDIAITP